MTTSSVHQLVSGTAITLDGLGVLLIGPSGSGKSDLAIRLIDAGASLVSDDVVELRRVGNQVFLVYPAAAPPGLKGRIEARGIGIVKVTAAAGPVALALVVRLVPPEKVQRMVHLGTESYLDVEVRLVELTPFEASCPAKVRLALHHNDGDIIAAP